MEHNGIYELDTENLILEYYKTSSVADVTPVDVTPVDVYVPIVKRAFPKPMAEPRGDMKKWDYVEYVLKMSDRPLSKRDIMDRCSDTGSSTIHHAVCYLQKCGKVRKYGTGARTTYEYIREE